MSVEEKNNIQVICNAEAKNNITLQDVRWYRIKNGEKIDVKESNGPISETDYQNRSSTSGDRLVRLLTIFGRGKLALQKQYFTKRQDDR